MLGATHLSIGITAALAVIHPKNIQECIAVTGIAACGAVISDIDADQSKVRRQADLLLGLGTILLAAVFIAEAKFHINLTQYLSGRQTLSERTVAVGIFIILCVIGRMTSHRTFMHSIIADILFSITVCVMFSAQAAIAFAIAFATHILLDWPNCKGIQILWPYPKRFCVKLCASNGLVNRILCMIGTVTAINLFTGFAGVSLLEYIGH